MPRILFNRFTSMMTQHELESFPEGKRYYKEGWDAHEMGNQFDDLATRDWRNGWIDRDITERAWRQQ